ncbi:MAG: hypothetical protein QM767_01885 [Anaeromyxobacter sp.]
MKQITTSQTDNFEFSGHGLNLPDDHPVFLSRRQADRVHHQPFSGPRADEQL